MVIGILLIAASISLAAYNYWESNRAAEASDGILSVLQQEIEKNNDLTDPSSEMNVLEIDGYGYIGYLSIPVLGLDLPVMSEWDYSRLKIAPCLYYGSVKTDDMVIAAHNYNRHFGKISELKYGDDIIFTDMDGTVYKYRVGELETLPPTATEEMISSDWDLSLYTCTYGGRSRVTVRCERIK